MNITYIGIYYICTMIVLIIIMLYVYYSYYFCLSDCVTTTSLSCDSLAVGKKLQVGSNETKPSFTALTYVRVKISHKYDHVMYAILI